jgi:hypothetical protein
MVLFGYRPSERGIILNDDEIPDNSYKLTSKSSSFYNSDRQPVRRSLGCHFDGAALPVPDMNYAPDQVAGATKRVAAKMPTINRCKLRKFKRFTTRFCKKHLTPFIFHQDEQFDFYEWINDAPYPDYRKQELIKVYEASKNRKPKMTVKAFIKNEGYPAYKHVRGIYSRHDEYKVRVGPFFKKLGDIVFNLKWFIKKIPINLRPAAMKDKFGDNQNIFCTDFSQYEATFNQQLMSIELIVYRFLLKDHPMKEEIIKLIVQGTMSENRIQFYKWSMKIMCKRMSGEMSTSVSNGLMNLLITHFLLEEAGNKIYDSYIEGDDSVNHYDVRPPTVQEYADLGANIKIEYPSNLCEASFCGNVFDEEDLDNVVNPIEALVSFGWTTSQYISSNPLTLRKLLKAKALSLLYQYSGCPILRSLALYALRMTNDIPIKDIMKTAIKNKDNYDRQRFLSMIDNFEPNRVFLNEVKNRTRCLVDRMYGISPDQQIKIEEYFDNKNDLSPINQPEIIKFCHPDWVDYYSSYSTGKTSFKNRESIEKVNVTTGYSTKMFLDPVWYTFV